MKKICINVLNSLLFLLAANLLHAENVSLNKLDMNGIASFEKLRKEYYIGALYLSEKSNFPDYVLSMPGRKVMDIRIVADGWTSRNFNGLWTEAILINNDEATQTKLRSVIMDFGKMLKGDLKKGDRLSFVYTPNAGTSIILNGARLMETKDDGLFNLLLNSWIGMRPFSSDFKRDLLNLSTEPKTAELIKRYNSIKPSAKRIAGTASWATKPEEEKPEVKPESKKVVAATTPTAATPSKESAKPVATPAPKAEPAKPPVAAATPAAAPVAPPAPAPAAIPPPPPLPVAPAATTADQLFEVYKSNIYKLTYRNTIYPPRSINLKQEGVIVLKIKINRDGKVINTTEEKTSEFASLNKAAETAIKRSAPYPAPPEALKGDSFEISIPFNFKL
jgi:protein TonB